MDCTLFYVIYSLNKCTMIGVFVLSNPCLWLLEVSNEWNPILTKRHSLCVHYAISMFQRSCVRMKWCFLVFLVTFSLELIPRVRLILSWKNMCDKLVKKLEIILIRSSN
mmetsp:Transcript_114368/g.323328  ORF Transcript_114368/g.323328 Transcript_114368/m.323328 type:complete len:109 (-) Transcript_114368:490-816(-)